MSSSLVAHKKLVVVVFGVIFAAIWSLSYMVARIALVDVSPIWLAGGRLFLAGLLLMLCFPKSGYMLWSGGTAKFRSTILIAGVLSYAVYLSACYLALVYFPTSVVNIVVSSLPLITVPVAYLILREQARLIDIVAFVMCILGVSITLTDDFSGSSLAISEYAFAIGILLVSVFSLALGNVLMKPIISNEQAIQICAIQFVTSGIILLAIATVISDIPTLDAVIKVLGPLLFLVLAGSIVGTILWFKVLSTFSTIEASSFFLLTPVFGILGGNIFFDETISISKILGVLVISAAIILRILNKKSRQRKQVE